MKRPHRALLSRLSKAKAVLIGTHKNPDGDAIGSALALARFIDTLRKPCEVLCHDLPRDNLRFLPDIDRVRLRPEGRGHDLGIVVDLESVSRLGDAAPYFEGCRQIVVIDHHLPHEAPGDLRLVDPTAPATAVLVTRFLLDAKAKIDPDTAQLLLTGIVTDTGGFRFRNTTPEALHLGAKLLELGGDIAAINHHVFESKPLSDVRLLGIMLAKMQLEMDGRLCHAALSQRDFELTETTDEATEGFVNHLLCIETVQVAVLLREHIPGRWRISLRSTDRFDVAAVARSLGGGGHRNAAGCSIEGTEEQALERLRPELQKCLESC
ncbi:MAG: bifunctional oligoribonuclease/PAP phosphatase NrnA [Fimbriimonadales bacterium]|nr:bifunctional oligoribonuclease/PAP phosphatase NrnA [Fimbriimonadales bacterium]